MSAGKGPDPRRYARSYRPTTRVRTWIGDDPRGTFHSNWVVTCGYWRGCRNTIDMVFHDHEVRALPDGLQVPLCLQARHPHPSEERDYRPRGATA